MTTDDKKDITFVGNNHNLTLLFRGRAFDNSKWIYGALINVGGNIYIRESEYTEGGGGWGHYTYWVHTESIGQYAFQKLFDGTKIFTGDILSKRWLAEVYQDSMTGAFMVCMHGSRNKRKITLQDYLKSCSMESWAHRDRDLTIIGTIYDTKFD